MYNRKPYPLLIMIVTLAVVTLSCGIGASPPPAPDPTATATQPDTPQETSSQPEAIAPTTTPQPPSASQTPVAEPALQLDTSQFQPGGEIEVHFTAPDSWPSDAWIGIIPSDIPHGDEAQNDEHDLTYQYLEGETTGTLIFTAPDAPGTYDFRLHDTDSDGKELASVSFVVTAEEEAEAVDDHMTEYDTPFPLPDDVQQYLDLSGDGLSINFQTSMSIDESVEFYQQALSDMGLTERPLLTVIEEGTFSMVYDGWKDGLSVVVQGVDLGESTNVNIRLEKV